VRRVSLRRADVAAFVFWTRQPGPFLPVLAGLEREGVPFYLLVSLLEYPRLLEPGAPRLADVLPQLESLRRLTGRSRLVWRYDPLIVSPLTGFDFHRDNFARLAAQLAPYCSRVIVSFLDFYRKTARRLGKLGVAAVDLATEPALRSDLLGALAAVALQHGLEIQACAEEETLLEHGIRPGKCIDEELLNREFGLDLAYKKDARQRPACRCQQSVDIGQYGTCRFGCVYCYAT
jgi:DNA repair photolyase